jgi:hypothetical protein
MACDLALPWARTQLARISHRQVSGPRHTFPMAGARAGRWREQLQVPEAARLLSGEVLVGTRVAAASEWAGEGWPSLAEG